MSLFELCPLAIAMAKAQAHENVKYDWKGHKGIT